MNEHNIEKKINLIKLNDTVNNWSYDIICHLSNIIESEDKGRIKEPRPNFIKALNEARKHVGHSCSQQVSSLFIGSETLYVWGYIEASDFLDFVDAIKNPTGSVILSLLENRPYFQLGPHDSINITITKALYSLILKLFQPSINKFSSASNSRIIEVFSYNCRSASEEDIKRLFEIVVDRELSDYLTVPNRLFWLAKKDLITDLDWAIELSKIVKEKVIERNDNMRVGQDTFNVGMVNSFITCLENEQH